MRLPVGAPLALPAELLHRFPELRHARYRRGGLPPRVGGWALGRRTVAAITLWRTIFLGRDAPVSAELLLHEFRHVQQFQASRSFPVLYLWETVRRGYFRNRYELDAQAYAATRLRAASTPSPSQDI